jgi:hypothetical protein
MQTLGFGDELLFENTDYRSYIHSNSSFVIGYFLKGTVAFADDGHHM